MIEDCGSLALDQVCVELKKSKEEVEREVKNLTDPEDIYPRKLKQ